MEQPTGLKMLELALTVQPDDKCVMARAAYNSARRAKLAYGTLVFGLAVVLAVAVVYAIVTFRRRSRPAASLG